MNILEIEDLISKYWNCETSEKEEIWLKNFFSQGEVPVELKRYQSLFLYQKYQAQLSLGNDFDEKILNIINQNNNEQKTKEKRLLKVNFFDKITKVAAIAFIVLIGGIAVHSFNNRKELPLILSSYDEIGIASPIAKLAMMSVFANYTEGERDTKIEIDRSITPFLEALKKTNL